MIRTVALALAALPMPGLGGPYRQFADALVARGIATARTDAKAIAGFGVSPAPR